MLARLIFLFALWPSLAFAQQYLVEPTLADCQTRSAAQCVGCDGVHTKYWWECLPLTPPTTTGGVSGTGGAYALELFPGTPYGTDGLSQAEIAAIQTEEQLDAVLGNRSKKAKGK